MRESKLAPQFHLYTDTAGSIGFGALMNQSWFNGTWDDHWWHEKNIMLLELYPIWAALQIWRDMLQGQVLMVHTDNMSLVNVIQKMSSRVHMVNALLRDICLLCMVLDIVLKVEHIPGTKNILADLLSRSQVGEFLSLAKDMDNWSTEIPRDIQPASCKSMLKNF